MEMWLGILAQGAVDVRGTFDYYTLMLQYSPGIFVSLQ